MGEDVNTLAGYLQMVILLCRDYFARISFYLTFWGTFLQIILMKLLVVGCLRSKKQTTHGAPSSLALYGVDALHVSALRNVATFFMSQYTNFIQFGGESDGATRCAQVTQLLAAAWAQHSDENPLVVIQLDIVNAYPSADRQAQFDVLAGRASKSYDNGHVHMGNDIPCPASLRHY